MRKSTTPGMKNIGSDRRGASNGGMAFITGGPLTSTPRYHLRRRRATVISGRPPAKPRPNPKGKLRSGNGKGEPGAGLSLSRQNIIEPGGDPIGSRSSGLALRGSNPLGVLFDLGSCCAMVEQTPRTLLRSCDDNMPPSCGDRNRILATMLISAAKGGKRTRSLARRLQPRGNSAAAQAPTGQFGTTS